MFVAVCEDMDIEKSEVVSTLEKLVCIKNVMFFNNPKKLLEHFEENKFDIIFLDTKLPYMDGIETAKAIRDMDPDIFIVFVTAQADFCLDAFSVYAADYILKPLRFKRLENTVKRIHAKVANDDKKVIEIKTQNTVYRVKQSDIVLIEKVLNRCMVYTAQFTFDVIMPLKYFEDILDKDTFIRSHAGYLVNRDKIFRIDVNGNLSYTIHFNGINKTALVSRSKKNRLFEYMSNTKAGIGI